LFHSYQEMLFSETFPLIYRAHSDMGITRTINVTSHLHRKPDTGRTHTLQCGRGSACGDEMRTLTFVPRVGVEPGSFFFVLVVF
jgi:hypothetical protein